MNFWFTADYHLNHANIIIYCNRHQLRDGDLNELGRWKSREISKERVEEMNQMIIKNHNERVKPDDVVIHNGDFCFKNSIGGKLGEGESTSAKELEKQLNGKIIMIEGNHDKNNSCRTIIQRLVIKIGGRKINIVHNPDHRDIDYDINFVAHVHNHWKFKRINRNLYDGDKGVIDLINIGIDVWNYYPVSFNEIMKEYCKWIRTIKEEI